jgi:osmotically inducible lipoprotein OsmB
MIRKIALSTTLAATLLTLAACGSTPTERGVTGAGLGAAAGYAVGAPIIGAVAGGAAGAFTEKDDINLGEPIWKWD